MAYSWWSSSASPMDIASELLCWPACAGVYVAQHLHTDLDELQVSYVEPCPIAAPLGGNSVDGSARQRRNWAEMHKALTQPTLNFSRCAELIILDASMSRSSEYTKSKFWVVY